MQIFELHFNPKKENHAFNTFLSEPQNDAERKKGSLYMAGEITSPLLKPEEFLGKLASIIKKSFYSQKLNPESSLTASLKSTNDFLGEEVKKENVGWLGNLNFAVVSIKDYNLVFSKTGDIKLMLIRQGKIANIGKNLSLEGVDPYPVKIFFNVASGKLAENDILLVLSNNVFEFIKEKGILKTLANSQDVNPKKIKELLPQSLFTKGEGSNISGFSLIFLLKDQPKTPLSALLQPKEIVKKHNIFPVSIITKPIKDTFSKVKQAIPKKKIKLPKIKNPFVSIKSPAVEKLKKPSNIKKKAMLVIAFSAFLLLGFIVFRVAQNRSEKDLIKAFNKVEQKVKEAESLLLAQNQEEADKLLKEAFKEIIPLTEKNISITPSILSLKETIEGNLERLNNLENIESPETAFIIDNFNPGKIAASTGNIYLYNNSNVVQKIVIKTGEKQFIEISDNIKSVDSSSGAILAHAGENKVYYSKKEIWEGKELNIPSSYQTSFDLFSSYLFNLYFIDKESCDITKYPYLTNFQWGPPKLWHEDFGKTCFNPLSVAIDGSIWVLNQDNTITRYHTGEFQENIELDIFPFPEGFKEINIRNNLYILEPKNNRVIILSKDGKIIKQFQSERFDNLKSFALSENGKTIYLLNNSTVFKIEL